MYVERAKERILEVTNLAEGLEDADANWLTELGVRAVESVIAGIDDEQAAGARVNSLIKLLRGLGRIAADRAALDAEALSADVADFFAYFGEITNGQLPIQDALQAGMLNPMALAAQIGPLTAIQAMQHLIQATIEVLPVELRVIADAFKPAPPLQPAVETEPPMADTPPPPTYSSEVEDTDHDAPRG